MAFPRSKGRRTSPLAQPDDSIELLGDSNLQKRALGVGTVVKGKDVGRLNAVYAEVDLTNVADLNAVDISHRLKAKPTTCELVEVKNSAGPVFASVSPVGKDKWSTTNTKMAVTLHAGSAQAGTRLVFRVGGA